MCLCRVFLRARNQRLSSAPLPARAGLGRAACLPSCASSCDLQQLAAKAQPAATTCSHQSSDSCWAAPSEVPSTPRAWQSPPALFSWVPPQTPTSSSRSAYSRAVAGPSILYTAQRSAGPLPWPCTPPAPPRGQRPAGRRLLPDDAKEMDDDSASFLLPHLIISTKRPAPPPGHKEIVRHFFGPDIVTLLAAPPTASSPQVSCR